MTHEIEKTQVFEAVQTARGYPEIGLSAQRRINNVGGVDWFVGFGLNSFMTHMTDEDVTGWTDKRVADFIFDNWNPDWDDIQVESPVGDFSIGSSDFTQTHKDTTQ